jgi:HD superfamily phosphohydrolase
LRYVRQLGLAYLVYPGATHTRFEHALGTFNLARRALALLDDDGSLAGVSREECLLVRVAALLHDVGHYPFSHALEEIGVLHHEAVAGPLVSEGEIGPVLREEIGPDASRQVLALIRGAGSGALAGLVSGSLDLDKIEYLKRDAFMCGVPYGEIDVDRLLNALVVVPDPITHISVIGVREKGLSALESLLFAKYQMYRNVYWHHAVRSATAMYKRLVEDALAGHALEPRTLATFTDEGLLHHLEAERPSMLLDALRNRRLFKRAFECPAAELEAEAGEWIAADRALAVRVEDALSEELGLAKGELLLDYPAKTQMLGLDIPVLRRSGDTVRLTSTGLEGAIHLPTLSEQLYRSARWLRVFVARPVTVDRAAILGLVRRDRDDVAERLARGALLD